MNIQHFINRQDQYFLLKHSIVLILSGLTLYFFVPVGGTIDLALIRPFIDANGEFSLRQHWALATLNHQYVKDVLIAVYLMILARWLGSFILTQWAEQRWQYGYFIALVLLSTACIGLLKSQAAHACPWDMLSATPQGLLWEFGASQGHCFPGGHAATGFALMVGYFVYRGNQPKRSYFFLMSSLILGMALGWAQMMRGAHFLSHNLYTAWVIYGINIIAYAIFAHKLMIQPKPKT